MINRKTEEISRENNEIIKNKNKKINPGKQRKRRRMRKEFMAKRSWKRTKRGNIHRQRPLKFNHRTDICKVLSENGWLFKRGYVNCRGHTVNLTQCVRKAW
jgi:hypothetical protein